MDRKLQMGVALRSQDFDIEMTDKGVMIIADPNKFDQLRQVLELALERAEGFGKDGYLRS